MPKLLFLFILLSYINNQLAAQPGLLKPDFGNGGKVITAIGNGTNIATGISVQPDGKIIGAGYMHNGLDHDISVLRYNTNGTLDNTFGTAGIQLFNFGSDEFSYASAIQPDGKVLIAGHADQAGSGRNLLLLRLNTNGAADNTFGNNGKVSTVINATDDFIVDMLLQEDGKIVLLSQANGNGPTYLNVIRYNTDGTLDHSFDGDGVVTLTAPNSQSLSPVNVVALPDGRILLAAMTSQIIGFDIALIRLLPNGSLDGSFGSNGNVLTDFGGANEFPRSLSLLPDGKFILSGDFQVGSHWKLLLVRYNPDGSIDNSFGTSGKVVTSVSSGHDLGWTSAIQTDGKIIVGAWADNGGANNIALCRFSSAGELDVSFGTNGKTLIDLGGTEGVYKMKLFGPTIYLAGYTDAGGTLDALLLAFTNDAAGYVCAAPIASNTLSVPVPSAFCLSGDPSIINGSVPVGGTGEYAYQWQASSNGVDFTDIDGAISKDFDPGTITVTTHYRRKISSGSCVPVFSNSIEITVSPSPTIPIITPAGPTTFCQGGKVDLQSSPATGYQWLQNDLPLPDATTQQVTAAASGYYRVRITDANGCSATSAATTVTVNPLPAAPALTAGSSTNFCPGDSVQLTSSSAIGNQWYKHNLPISAATNSTLTVSDSGVYTVRYTDGTCYSLPSGPVAVQLLDCNFPANPYLVSTLDTATGSSINMAGFESPLTIDSLTYFPAFRTGNSEPGLWRTNGTPEGTWLVKSMGYNNTSFRPSRLTRFNGLLFFSANDDSHGEELWKSDGTEEGTVLVKDITPGTASSSLRNFTVSGNLLFFTVGVDLWASDGTEAGTNLVKGGIINNAQTETDFCFADYNGTLYFNGFQSATGNELWKSDGTPQGTTLVKDIRVGTANSSPVNFVGSGGQFYFVTFGAGGRELWISDGTANGTQLVKAIGNFSATATGPNLYDIDGRLLFVAGAGSNYELWKSDGTSEGTAMVKDINPGTAGSFPESFAVVGSTIYFTATTPTQGYELWKSDGTEGGTRLVKDILPGAGSGRPMWTRAADGVLYFSANSGNSQGVELWKSDGTAEGTVLVEDIWPGINSSFPSRLTPNGTLQFFVANNGTQGSEPWISNGTEEGTYLLKEINAQRSVTPAITKLTSHKGHVYFEGLARVGANLERHLWKSDGTPSGTVNLTAALTNPAQGNADFTNFVSLGDHLFFTGVGFFKTDGVHVTDMNLPVVHLTKAGNRLFYLTGFSSPLYSTDGITPGQSVKLCDNAQSTFAEVNGTLYFIGYTASTGWELWKSDGTVAGTELLKDVLPGVNSSNISNFINVDGTLFFTTPTQLWKSDGTANGTVLVKTLGWTPYYPVAFNNKLYFIGFSGATGHELWSSDGTPIGTDLLKDIQAGTPGSFQPNSSNPYFTVVGNELFFRADDGTHGMEVWKTNGAADGTVLLKDIYAGSPSSEPAFLANVSGYLCFAATSPESGVELWFSGGSEECTRLVTDLFSASGAAGPMNSFPQQLLAVNDVVYYVATAPYIGSALHKFNPNLTITAPTVFTFNGSGNWSNTANWCNGQRPPAVLPAGSEIVVKPGLNGVSTVDKPVTISKGARLTIQSGAQLEVPRNLQTQGGAKKQ